MKNLRVGVDGFNLSLSKGTGVATYSMALTHALHGMGCGVDMLYGLPIPVSIPDDLKEILFFDKIGTDNYPRRPKFPKLSWWLETRKHFCGHLASRVPITGNVLLKDHTNRFPNCDRVFNVPSLFRAAHGFFRTTGRFLPVRIPNGPDIMHWTYPLPIEVMNAKNVYTIHDIVPLTMPHTTLDDKNFYYNLIKKVVEKSHALCSVSDFSVNNIVNMFPNAKGKIFNTYQSHCFSEHMIGRSEKNTADEVERLFSLKNGGYFLYFGQLEPKKNVGRIIRAFLEADTSRKLVIVGSHGWKQESELRFLQHGIDQGRIVHLQYLPVDLLLSVVRHAHALLFPSIAEGFGLPVLEAFSLGTPVLTSNEGALKEISGEAALFVDPYNTDQITAGINRLDKDEDFCQNLIKMGRKQCQKFSMIKYQQRLKDLYEIMF